MKSDTATLLLPDLDIEVIFAIFSHIFDISFQIPPGKGRYTTIEEFLKEIYEDLQNSGYEV